MGIIVRSLVFANLIKTPWSPHPHCPAMLEAVRLNLPSNVSREGHAPQDCLAVVIDDVLTPSECQELIDLASSKFARPVAASFEIDGQTYHLENPRVHERAS